MASMVVSMAWVDLLAPELKSERKRKCTGLVSTCWHPTLCIEPFVLLLFRCPRGTALLMSLHPDATPEGEGQIQKSQTGGKIDGVRADVCCKIGGERADGLSHQIVGKKDVEKIEVELVRNELMGSTEKGRLESRITAPWCGSRVAGWRVAAGKTTGLIGVLSLLTSEASFVPVAWIWNAMVPRLENGDDSQKTGYQSDACNSFGGFAEPGDSESIEEARRWRDFDGAGGHDGFDGVDGGFDGFDGFDGDGGFHGVEGDSDGFVGLGDTNGEDGTSFAGFGGLDGLGDRS